MKSHRFIHCFALLFLHHAFGFPQNKFNPPFPRIVHWQWEGGMVEYRKKFHWSVGTGQDEWTPAELKRKYPNSLVLRTGDYSGGADWSYSQGRAQQLPWQFHNRDAKGRGFKYEDPIENTDSTCDPTDYCPQVQGDRYNWWLPKRLVDSTDWRIYSGLSNDGGRAYPWAEKTRSIARYGFENIDFDRNGLNDLTEPGKGTGWVQETWQGGWNSLYSHLRSYLTARGHADALLFYWTSGDSIFPNPTFLNGVGQESFLQNTEWNIYAAFEAYQAWCSKSRKPVLSLIDAEAHLYDTTGYTRQSCKDYFRYMRWTLGFTLMSDGYYKNSSGYQHHVTWYYDEYDTNLGYPTTHRRILRNGCWVRFFDNGCVILNPTNATQTVIMRDLAPLSGYAGPYYRFKGNQDEVWNDGSAFESARLISTVPNVVQTKGASKVGDGIILMNKPTVVVSDIIVDNSPGSTSPGSRSATLNGLIRDATADGDPRTPGWNILLVADRYPGGREGDELGYTTLLNLFVPCDWVDSSSQGSHIVADREHWSFAA